MHKALLNQLLLDISIEPQGPILIKERAPDEGEDAAGKEQKKKRNDKYGEPDMLFVRIERRAPGGVSRLEPFIPGSSLKGLLRSHAERIARTLNPANGTCDPLGDGSTPFGMRLSCSRKLDKQKKELQAKGSKMSPQEIYSSSCPICRIFGNASLRSRIDVDDAYLAVTASPVVQPPPPLPGEQGDTSPWWWDANAWQSADGGYFPKRTNVAIDRFTGGAKDKALFDYETWRGGFHTRIVLRNFELWHLGLMAFLARDLSRGVLRIGYGKNRGLGRIKGMVKEAEITYYGRDLPKSNELWGIDKMMVDGNKYGIATKGPLTLKGIPQMDAMEDMGYGRVYRYDAQEFETISRTAAQYLVEFIQNL